MAISNAKIALLKVAVRELNIRDHLYREMLRRVGGVESARDLDDDRFAAVMAFLNEYGFESKTPPLEFGYRPGMATPAQIELIRRSWRDYTGRIDDRAVGAWLHRTFKVSDLRFLDQARARKAITALKRMTARRQKQPEDDAAGDAS